MVQLSATRCSCIAALWVSLVSFAAITLCVASQHVFIVVYFVIDSIRKLLYTPSYKRIGLTASDKPDISYAFKITVTTIKGYSVGEQLPLCRNVYIQQDFLHKLCKCTCPTTSQLASGTPYYMIHVNTIKIYKTTVLPFVLRETEI
jgi:hypothetical protein